MEQQRSKPLPYPTDHKRVHSPEARFTSALRESIPTLDPLPSMASAAPNEALLSTPDIKSRHDTRDLSYTPLRTVLRPTDLPSVPVKEPGQRTESIGSGNAMSIDSDRRDQSASIEDPDDRMAAEVLAGLGKAGKLSMLSCKLPKADT